MKKQKISTAFILIIAVMAVVSCTKWDEYKQYTTTGETAYTGKLDSIKIYSGRLRVKLRGILPADPKITRCKITWNDKKDSIEFNITKGPGSEIFERILSVEEGVKNFTFRTFDAAGNPSVLSTATGASYGSRYESGLVNRPVLNGELLSNGNTVITWDNFDTTSGAKFTLIDYTTTSNAIATVLTPNRLGTTTLPNYKSGTTYSYRTAYLPDSTAIDTFYSTKQTMGVKYEITSLYLGNAGPAFQRATFDGRWGTLAAPWITNAAAKNKGGINGGYSSDAGGVINWETWGNTPVVNGIIYQPTSAPLPAGKYIVSFDEYSEIQTNSSVYCVAAAGGSGIPVLANLSTALGFVALYNGAAVGATTPSLTDTRSFNFTLTTPQIVSIGFLGNIVGAATNGGYFQVFKIKLYSNN